MTRFYRLGCLLNLIFFAALASGQDFMDGELIGKTFWVKPSKEIYRRLEFYRQPKLEASTFFPPSKKQIRIINVGRGWIRLSFVSGYNGFEEAFIPVGYLKRNLYSQSIYSSYAFDRATFFTEDPDTLKERAEAPSAEPIGKRGKSKSVVSKFFRHKKKCCGMGTMSQPAYINNPSTAPK